MIKEYNEQHNFNHIAADAGMVLTDYDGIDILKYSSFVEGFFPTSISIDAYYEITIEEDAEYKVLQDIAIKEEEEKMKAQAQKENNKKE